MKKKSIRWIGVILAVVLVAVSGVLLFSASANTVTFSDPQLEAALKSVLNTSSVTNSQLESLTDLDLSGKGITNLTGLEKAKNLKTLSLRGNQLADLSAVASMASLETLDVCENQITSLAPLRGLQQLRVLQLSDNKVSDLSPVADLKMLQFLFCERNALDSTEGSAAMQQVAALRYRGMYVSLDGETDQNPSQPDGTSGEIAVRPGFAVKLNRATHTITGIQPGTLVSSLRDALDPGSHTIRVLDASGSPVTQPQAGTGLQVQLVNSRNEVLEAFTVLVYGDVNGDGSIDVIDLAMIRKDIVSDGALLHGVLFDAGNLAAKVKDDPSDTVVDVIDVAVLRKYIVGDLTIPQD